MKTEPAVLWAGAPSYAVRAREEKARQAGQQAGPRGVRASASAWGSRRVGRAKQGRPGRGRKKAGLVLELGQ